MKTVKSKIIAKLKAHEHSESLTQNDIRRDTVEEILKLSKALCYLEKAEAVMNGKTVV